MDLLRVHKILISFALALAVILLVWGVRHRRQSAGLVTIALGVVAIPATALYLRKLARDPPIRR